MTAKHVQFTFAAEVPMSEVEGTLELAILAAEIFHGRERVDLEACYQIDVAARMVKIDRSAAVGETIATAFLGYSRREFGHGAVTIKRVDASNSPGIKGPTP